MSTDTITTYLGVVLGALHQVGVVGTVPSTKTEWLQTGMSVLLAVMGYLTNKPPTPPLPAPAQ
jgi:hypothetical protein